MARTDKAKLKELRGQRAAFIDNARQRIKQSNKLIKKIKTRIKDRAMTIPQIAQAVEEPSSTVLVYVSGMKKFGLVTEMEKEGDYFTYQLTASKLGEQQ